MGKTLRRSPGDGGGWRRAVGAALRTVRLLSLVLLAAAAPRPAMCQEAPKRLDRGRFTAVYYPSEATLAQSLLDVAVKTDTFPGLPRPRAQVLLALAPDKRRFREWAGPGAPEWGAAITFPDSRRIVMQGRSGGAEAGDPRAVLRHELAHLALHEYLGDLPSRWFDEGYASYAAREWSREDVLATNLALAFRGTPTFDELDAEFGAGASTAQNAYALAYRAVVELAALDTLHGLSRFFKNWHEQQSMDRAVRSTFGLTLAGFEKQWQRDTRRRYGVLALISELTLGGAFLAVVMVPLYFARRQRDRQRMAALVAADEAADRAARASALEALLRGDDESGFGDERPGSPRI